MGTNAAVITRKVVENTFEVLAIHAIAVVQAVDAMKCAAKLSPYSNKIYTKIRKICPVFINDSPQYKTIGAVREFLKKEPINVI